MRNYLLTFILLVTVSTTASAEIIDLYIFAGQSNMQGWQGDGAEYPDDPERLDFRTRLFYVSPGIGSSDGEWTWMSPQVGRFPDGHFGPEVTFARSMRVAGRNPAVFKYTLGSTGLAEDWQDPGDGGLYDRMCAEYRKAVERLKLQGHVVMPRAFIWVQGESDAKSQTLAEEYFDRLVTMIGDVRKNLIGDPNLPIVLGVDEQHPWVALLPAVVKAQQRFAEEDSFAIWTSMAGLEKADVTHLTPKGLEEHGRVLFRAYLKLLEQ